MSIRAEKGDAQIRKPGRPGSSGHHRGFSGSGGGGRGGGGPGHPHLSSSAAPAAPALSTSRSFNKFSNGQGAKARVIPANPSSEPSSATVADHAAQNDTHPPAPLHGSSDALAPGGSKPVDTKNSRILPKHPSSQPAAGAPDTAARKTPPKGDASKSFTLQFGTISAGIMNGMQIPARTSSAPPNLDEQKHDLAHHDSFRAVPTLPIPTAQKQQQQQTRKDAGVNPSSTGEFHPQTQMKRDAHVPVPSTPTLTTAKPSVFPIGGIPMHMPFQQPQIPIQFGGPIPQMQSQGVAASSLQMTMALPVGNPPQVPQQMFIPSIHSHPLQAQGMIHQGQGLGFAPQMGHQLTPQLGNLGFGITTHFPQQQPGKFSGPRKTTVKITHPDTHEELRLDKRPDSYMDSSTSGQRTLHNITPQSQPVPTFTPSHQINYYSTLQPNSYNTPPIFFPTSLPLTSTQMTAGSQAPRYSYPVSQGGQAISFMNQSVLNPMPSSKPGYTPPIHGVSEAVNLEGVPISAPSAPVQVTVKSPFGPYTEKVGTSSVTMNAPVSKAEPSVIITAPVSKAERSMTISTPISRAEPSVTASMPISKAEASKLLKPYGDNAAFQLQRNTESGPYSSFQQSKPDSEPLDKNSVPTPGRHSSAVLPALLMQRTQPGTSSSAPVTPIGDLGSVLVGTDSRKKEIVRRSESLKEHQKKPSKKDVRHSQQQNQIDMSDPAECTESSLPNMADVITRHISQLTEHIQSPSEADLSISTASLPSSSAEHCVSLEVGTSKAIEDKAIISSGSSEVILEKAASEEGPPGCSVASDLAADGASIKQRGASETFSLGPEVDGAITKSSDSSISPNESVPAEVGQEQEMLAAVDHGKVEVPNDSSLDSSDAKVYPVSSVMESSLLKEEEAGVENSKKSISCELNDSEKLHNDTSNEAVHFSLEGGRGAEETVSATTYSDTVNAESVFSSHLASANADEGRPLPLDTVSNKSEVNSSQDVGLIDLGISFLEMVKLPASISSEMTEKLEGKVTEMSTGNPVSDIFSGPKDKLSSEPARTKTTVTKKKKRKEILSKADAAGASDLYNAYKGPEQKQEIASTSGNTDGSFTVDAEQVHVDIADNDAAAGEEDEQNKAELDDWEDATDISTPKLNTSGNAQLVHGANKNKYSRDFLLTFVEQCTELPVGFEIGADIADALMSAQVGASREPHPSPGRITDRHSAGMRGDRRMGGMMDDGKWIKSSGSFGPGVDIGHGPAVMSSRTGQAANHGVLKNSRGLLSGPMQSMGLQGGIPRNSADADRWQRPVGFQRGLIPSPHTPHTPLQAMHKAEKKYEVGKVSDMEKTKQRQVKAILNKLTPQNFEKLFAQVTEVNIDNAVTLTGVISQIFDKALMEPTFCEMYANFCFHLAGALPDFSEDNEKITFRRLLLNKCQMEFERGEREQAEANKVEEEGEIKQSEEEREQKRICARRRMLGNIRLIGELYKKKMLTERIMHECIKKLLGQHQNPDEEDIEALCKLMSTIGEMIDHAKAKEHMDAYFDIMQKLSTHQKLSSRVRFMLRDSIDLRKNKWQQRRKIEGPKKIEEVHRDAAQERQAQSSRLARGPAMSSTSRRGPPVDYGPRGSTVVTPPSSQQIGSTRSFLPQTRGYTQDVRLEDRHQFENRTLSVPLSQRPIDDESLTLGPQGGLARVMSVRGQSLISIAPSAEIHPSISDPRRIVSGPNGYSSISDRAPFTSKEETMPRSMSDRFSGDRIFEKSAAIISSGRMHGPLSSSQNPPEAKLLSEEALKEKSIYAIREFYSAKDEEEVALCIKELNSPSFYPSMVSQWVTDSFERKDMERDLLARLLVNLCKSHDSLLSHIQLIQGFEFVLTSLEDAVNDAPKAAEFLGRIFAKAILENVVSLTEIGRLILEGGDEPGRLLEIGLASDVLGNILESIRTEKGDSVLNKIRTSSNLRLQDFRPPHPMKSKMLDAFL